MAKLLVPATEPDEIDLSEPQALADLCINGFMNPTARDRQVSIGPSGIGDPCDFCVGKAMALRLPDAEVPEPEQSGLASRIGTGVHFYLENLFVGPEWDAVGYQPEMPKVYCGTIPGYGDIKGTIDAYSELYATVLDFKFPSLAKIKKYRTHGIPTDYSYQRQVYGKGVELLGKPVRWVSNLFIPRDSNNPKDIWFDAEPYDPEAAQQAFDRAQVIWEEFVVPGLVNDLASDEDCYSCNGFNNQNGELVFKSGK